MRIAQDIASLRATSWVHEPKNILTFRHRRASAASISVSFMVPASTTLFMDVQTGIVHDFLHGCLVPFINVESGASHASLIADRSPLGDNPSYYTGIKHPLCFHAKP